MPASNDAPSAALQYSLLELEVARREALLLLGFKGCQQSLLSAALSFPQNKMQWFLTVSDAENVAPQCTL